MPTAKETTAKTEKLSVFVKLAKARTDFLAKTLTKSGKNIHAEFEYFELKDIVPTANEIFNRYNLLFLISFEDGIAYGRLVDLDNTEDIITVQFAIAHLPEPAKFRMNEIQAVGAEVTYYRRYLYMLILDIVDRDEIDGGVTAKAPEKPVEKPKAKPATPEERKSITEKLTAAEDKADPMQVDALKAVLKKLRETDPKQEEFVQTVAVKTKGFTEIKKAACEQLILKVNEMLENYGGES